MGGGPARVIIIIIQDNRCTARLESVVCVTYRYASLLFVSYNTMVGETRAWKRVIFDARSAYACWGKKGEKGLNQCGVCGTVVDA